MEAIENRIQNTERINWLRACHPVTAISIAQAVGLAQKIMNKEVRKMSGSQIFILVFLLGGAISFAIFLMGLGIYYWGRGHYEKSKRDDNK